MSRWLIGAWLAFLLALCLPPSVVWGGSLERVLMPGKVIQGHAQTEERCEACHVRFNRIGQDALCGACHKAVARDIEQQQGFHGRGRDGKLCRDCHAEHQGRGARIVVLDEHTFDHRQTDYPLKGKHVDVACKSCHVPGSKHRAAPGTCVSCHRKDDTHRGSLGPQCANCHTEASWKEAKFDHDKTRFQLEDSHARAKCADCHRNGVFKNTPMTCVACHRADDKHKGRFGDKCQTCHNAREWRDVQFDHDTQTRYALRGKHRTAACASCHTGYLYREKLQTACVACHRKDDKHNNALGSECARCHVERSWKEARFDHDTSRFPLRGRHADIECNACHKSVVFKDTPMNCIACHRKQDKHIGALGEQCASCHGERSWKEARFDHDKTRFSLLGRHREVKCASCHKDEQYKNTVAACIACHRKDDVHKGQQGEACETCHSAEDWKKTAFNHGRTRFPLVGRHQTVACRQCHPTQRFKDAKTECAACHDKDDVHKRRLGAQCESCHNARSWRLWDFNHDTRTRFRLDGGHRGIDCYACHRAPVGGRATLPTSCVSCHEKDDVHDGGFGPQCETCHETGSFRRIKSRLGSGMNPSRAFQIAATGASR